MEGQNKSVLGRGLAVLGLLAVLVFLFVFTSSLERESTGPEIYVSPQSAENVSQSESGDLAPVEDLSAWSTFSSEDQMTGVVSYFAVSDSVASTEVMRRPYDDISSWIGVGCDSTGLWVYVKFSGALNLTNGEISGGGTGRDIPVRVRWDNRVDEVTLWHRFGGDSLSFYDDSSAIRSLKSASTMKLELYWYGNGAVYFEYPLKGSSKAISETLSACGR